MKYEEFVTCVRVRVEEKLGEEVRTELSRITKNNDVILDGLTFFTDGSHLAPTVYLNELFKEYQAGKSISEIVEQIQTLYTGTASGMEFQPEEYMDYEKAKRRLACKLIHFRKNERLLKEVPYQKFLNLAIVPYYILDEKTSGKGSILVKKSHCRIWGVTEEEVLWQARSQTLQLCPPNLIRMGELVELYEEEKKEEMDMYVLTNEECYFGAAAMMFDSVLEKIGAQIRDDFWILPSSIHECIIVPVTCGMPADGMRNLVREVNETKVGPQDYLSDEIYYYQCTMHRLTCVEEQPVIAEERKQS